MADWMASDGGSRSSRGVQTSGGTSAGYARSIGLAAPVVGIAVSEALLYVGSINYALGGYVLTLLVCTLAPLRFPSEIDILSVFALLPLFRLVTMGMPAFFETTGAMMALAYAPMFLPLVVFARRRSVIQFSHRGVLKSVLWVLAGLPLGIGLAEAGYRVLRPAPLVSTWTIRQAVILLIVFFLFVGLIEELVFRGALQRTLQGRLGRWPGLLLASALFALMHAGYGSVSAIAVGALSGLAYGIMYDWTDSIALVTSMHGTLGLFLFAVIPHQGSLVPRLVSFLSRVF